MVKSLHLRFLCLIAGVAIIVIAFGWGRSALKGTGSSATPALDGPVERYLSIVPFLQTPKVVGGVAYFGDLLEVYQIAAATDRGFWLRIPGEGGDWADRWRQFHGEFIDGASSLVAAMPWSDGKTPKDGFNSRRGWREDPLYVRLPGTHSVAAVKECLGMAVSDGWRIRKIAVVCHDSADGTGRLLVFTHQDSLPPAQPGEQRRLHVLGPVNGTMQGFADEITTSFAAGQEGWVHVWDGVWYVQF